MSHVRKQRVVRQSAGFTIIELMLAMSFVAALLLAVAVTIVQVGTIYNKGMTLKEVNQTGRVISDDIRRSIASSSAFEKETSYFRVGVDGKIGGRLCTGTTSYVWNYAQAIQDGDTGRITFEDGGEEIRLFKIPDSSSAYCAKSGTGFVYTQVRPIDQLQGSELLQQGDRTLSIHQLDISAPDDGADPVTGQRLYITTFTIGTGDTTALTDDWTACLPPGDINSNFSYCAVQQFTLVTRAGNRVN